LGFKSVDSGARLKRRPCKTRLVAFFRFTKTQDRGDCEGNFQMDQELYIELQQQCEYRCTHTHTYIMDFDLVAHGKFTLHGSAARRSAHKRLCREYRCLLTVDELLLLFQHMTRHDVVVVVTVVVDGECVCVFQCGVCVCVCV
jgi:hypothetical protein